MKILRKMVAIVPPTLAAISVIFAVLIGFGALQARAVLTSSMSPTINKGDLVIGASWVEPKLTDIAIYREKAVAGNASEDVVHRIVAIDPSGTYTFKGDNNNSDDPTVVQRREIKGVILLTIPVVGALFNWTGAIAVVIVLLGILGISYGISALRRSKADEA
jgi:signal peptidase I